MTTTFIENPRTGDFILSEADLTLSRETVTIASGAGKLVAGTVLAQLTASGKYVPAKDAGADGSQIATAILYAGVDATAADVKAVVIYRLAEVKAPMLVFDASINAPSEVAAAIAQLATKSIVAR